MILTVDESAYMQFLNILSNGNRDSILLFCNVSETLQFGIFGDDRVSCLN